MTLWPVQGPLCLKTMNFSASVAYCLPARNTLKVSERWKSLGHILPAGHVTGYGDAVVKLWTALPTDPISRPMTSIYWNR